MPITRIIPTIRSGDTAATREFFADIIGLDVDMAEGTFVMFSSASEPAAQLVINDNGFVGGDRSVDLPPGLAIDVDDPRQVERLFREVTARGFAIPEPLHDTPWGIRRFTVVAPGGACVTIISHFSLPDTS